MSKRRVKLSLHEDTLQEVESISTTNSYDFSKFNIAEYQEYLTGEEYRKQQIEKLADNYRQLKSLQCENINILHSISDQEKNTKVVSSVSKVWNGVLETDTEVNTIEDIINMSLQTEENIQFLNDNKNKGYFPSGKVFEEHLLHPIQKKLTKGKYLSKRAVNKQKTPMQTINYVYNAKSNSDRDKRITDIEKSLAEAHYMISLLAVNQSDLNVSLDNHSTELQHQSLELNEVKQRLVSVEDRIKDNRKLKLYALYTSKKEPTVKEMAIELGVSIRTVKYWLKGLREAGVIV